MSALFTEEELYEQGYKMMPSPIEMMPSPMEETEAMPMPSPMPSTMEVMPSPMEETEVMPSPVEMMPAPMEEMEVMSSPMVPAPVKMTPETVVHEQPAVMPQVPPLQVLPMPPVYRGPTYPGAPTFPAGGRDHRFWAWVALPYISKFAYGDVFTVHQLRAIFFVHNYSAFPDVRGLTPQMIYPTLMEVANVDHVLRKWDERIVLIYSNDVEVEPCVHMFTPDYIFQPEDKVYVGRALAKYMEPGGFEKHVSNRKRFTWQNP